MCTRSRWIKVAVGCLVLLCFGSFLFSRRVRSRYAEQAVEQLVLAKSSVTTAAFDATETAPRSAGCTNVTRQRKPPGGFILAFRFWEQQTQAMKTVLQLQCLATHFGMQTVEPFLYRSFLGFPFPDLSTRDFLHLGDLIDVDVWNKEATKKFDLFPLTAWSEFLQFAPRNVIIVCIRYRTPPRIILPKPGFNYRKGCPNACYKRLNSSLAVLNEHGYFKIVRKACVNFIDYGGSVSESSLIENILGKHDYREVTVLINEFRGFYGLFRIQVLSSCGIDLYKPNLTIIPSVAIMNDATRYIAGVFSGKPYIAILVRIERVVLHLEHDITNCSNVLKSLLQTLSKQCNTKQYFLAMDVGKFGSSGSIERNLTTYGHTVLNAVYGGFVSFKEWESLFELYTSKVEEAYVANLQRAIAARSQCLVMFGAGGFQAQAREFYERQHPGRKDRCIHKICHEHIDAAPIHVRMS